MVSASASTIADAVTNNGCLLLCRLSLGHMQHDAGSHWLSCAGEVVPCPKSFTSSSKFTLHRFIDHSSED